MLVEAIYDNGRVVFPQQYRFAHNRFNIKVDSLMLKSLAAAM